MRAELEESLTDNVYRAVFEPEAWTDVMRLCAQAFPSNGQTFYFLDKTSGHVRPVALEGVTPLWRARFDTFYFAPDNPWLQLSRRLHRPGIVRTNERLAKLLRDDQALYRSVYYNEWMRPQGFRHSMGNTLHARDDLVANVTLLRAPDMPMFDRQEVAAFERLSRHMTRALRMAMRLDRANATGPAWDALEGARQPAALVDGQLRLVHANRAMETLLRLAGGLRMRDGKLAVDGLQQQHRLQAMVDAATAPTQAAADAPDTLTLQPDATTSLTLKATPARGAAVHCRPWPGLVLLTVTQAGCVEPLVADCLRRLHGCTPAETRLVMGLVDGLSLRAAAHSAGTTYESARTSLKRVFAKVGVGSQSQLVARLLRELPPR